jgi:hypothetical protein
MVVPTMEGFATGGRQVEETERHQAPVPGDNMDTTITGAFQIDVPYILERHRRNRKGMDFDSLQKIIKARNLGRIAAGLFIRLLILHFDIRCRPLPDQELLGFGGTFGRRCGFAATRTFAA